MSRFMGKLAWGLLAVPLSVAARVFGSETLTFVVAAVALIPLAGLMGKATEEMALHSGPRVGGFLNATFGNAAELIIGVFLIVGGEIEVVKASIAGSIIGNILLVLGLSFLLGGLKHREQDFDAKSAGMHAASLVLAVTGLMMLALFHQAVPDAEFFADEVASVGVALVLMGVYVLSIVYSFTTKTKVAMAPADQDIPNWTKRSALWVLVGATALVAVESEFLVSSLEHAAESFGLNKMFIGLILIPVVGNAAEHSSAVILALKNKVDVSIEIAIGSGTQVAMFVAPALLFVSLLTPHPMDFFFNPFEIAAVALSTAIVTIIALDGRSNWLEGAQLLGAYMIMSIAVLFLR